MSSFSTKKDLFAESCGVFDFNLIPFSVRNSFEIWRHASYGHKTINSNFSEYYVRILQNIMGEFMILLKQMWSNNI